MINLFIGAVVAIIGSRGEAVERAEVAGFQKCGELGEGEGVDTLAARAFDFQSLLQFFKKQTTALTAQFNIFFKIFRRTQYLTLKLLNTSTNNLYVKKIPLCAHTVKENGVK